MGLHFTDYLSLIIFDLEHYYFGNHTKYMSNKLK